MRKLIVHMSTGYAGMDAHEALPVSDDATEDEIAEEAWLMAVQYAESYGIYPYEEYADEEDFDADSDSYSHNIDAWTEDYDPRKHDGLRSGGGSFEDDFRKLMP